MTDQMHRLGFVSVVVALLALVSTAAASADLKVAFVDMQRALNDSNAGKRAKNDFRSEIGRLQNKLQRQQQEVQSLKDELDRKGPLMRDDERRNLQDDYTRKLRDFERAYKDSKDELQQKDNEVTGAIVRDLAYIVRNLGERDGYTVVLEKGSLLWAAPSIDITDQVIREYNASGSRIGSLGDKLNQGEGLRRSSSSQGSLSGGGMEEAPPTRPTKRSSISR
ncbi:MAG TPA: OmpH family outer membrane protein [Candidatus Binataceae bacterium]|nr:OmpH family outer membrane protein [Candidatus Binataceae bacterium]